MLFLGDLMYLGSRCHHISKTFNVFGTWVDLMYILGSYRVKCSIQSDVERVEY